MRETTDRGRAALSETTVRRSEGAKGREHGCRMKKKHPDFVKWLTSQLSAFRARRFEKLDVEEVGCELEAVVGRYKYEVSQGAERLIPPR